MNRDRIRPDLSRPMAPGMPSRLPGSSLRLAAALLGLCLAGAAACDDDEDLPRVDAAGGSGGRDGGVDSGVDTGGSGGSDAAPIDSASDTVTEAGNRDGGDAGDAGGDTAPAAVVDRDIAVVRLLATGAPDTSFGTNGVAIVDLGGIAGTVRDDLYGLTVDKMNRPVLFGSKKGDGMRTDQDRAVARLTAAGQLDTSFGTMGVNSLNIGTLGDNPRHGLVQADGKIVASGYTNQPTGVGIQTANAVVLLRLLDTGMPDTTFGASGVVNFNPFRSPDGIMLAGMTEAYSIVQQSTGNYVTVGYARGVGQPSTAPVDLVINRWSATTGALDTTFAVNGARLVDVAGGADQARNLAVLPGDKLMVVGNATPAPMSGDAIVVITQPDGALDTTFNTTGYKTYDFMRPSEALYGVAVNARRHPGGGGRLPQRCPGRRHAGRRRRDGPAAPGRRHGHRAGGRAVSHWPRSLLGRHLRPGQQDLRHRIRQ